MVFACALEYGLISLHHGLSGKTLSEVQLTVEAKGSYMKIWVDADACPGVIKNILFKAADRTRVELTLVANHPMKIPQRNYIKFLQVSSGFDEADNRILERLKEGDLVITGDIPLATQVLGKKAYALNPRGHLYSDESIQEQLRMRAFKESLRDSGIDTGGPAAMNQKNTSKFANHLNNWLTQCNLMVRE